MLRKRKSKIKRRNTEPSVYFPDVDDDSKGWDLFFLLSWSEINIYMYMNLIFLPEIILVIWIFFFFLFFFFVCIEHIGEARVSSHILFLSFFNVYISRRRTEIIWKKNIRVHNNMNKQKKKKYIYIFYLISWKSSRCVWLFFRQNFFLSQFFSFSRLNSVFVFVFSPISFVFFSLLVYSKLHINKLITRTVILVRIYLIDTCADFFFLLSLSLSFLFLFATKCYLSFCLVFFFSCTTAEDFFVKCVCVCISLMAVLYALSFSFSFLDNSNKYHTFNILIF
jgi:hypothetical protein